MSSSQFNILRGEDAQQSRVQDNISAVLAPIARALQSTPIMGAAPPPWIQLTPAAGFATPAATGFAAISVHRDALGYVHARFSVSSAAGAAAFSLLFTLPVGYRPGVNEMYPVTDGITPNQSVSVETNGFVRNRVVIGAGGSAFGSFSFLAEF